MLFVVNDDRPGRIGRLGTLLGEAEINIANMAVSRNRPRSRALMVLTLDSPIPEDVLERIRAEPGLLDPQGDRAGACETTSAPDGPSRSSASPPRCAKAAVEARIEEFGEGTPTAADAAAATGAPIDQIVKSLVFAGDGRPLVVMVPGDARADTAKIAAAAGCERVKAVGADAVERLTGFPPGGVAPFPLPGIETVLIEQALLGHEVVWIGAGSQRHMAALAPSDLARLARARPARLTVE